jgi:hypothetical protein
MPKRRRGARLSLMDKTAGGCYLYGGGVSLLGPLLEQSRPLTRLLIRKGSLPGVAPLGRPAIQPAWTLLEGSDRWGCRLRHTPRPPVRYFAFSRPAEFCNKICTNAMCGHVRFSAAIGG